MDDDAALLRAWQAGDRAAGHALVTRHYDAVERFFQNKAGAEADDLVQLTFLRWQAATWRGEGSLRAFLLGVARNVLYEHVRRRVRDGPADVEQRSIADLRPGVATQAAQRAKHRLLLRALQRIPLEGQVLLELFYWEDLSIAELAVTLDVPEGTVKSRLHRARGWLRDAIARAPAEDGDPASVRALLAAWLEAMERR